MSQNYPSKPWNKEDAEKALRVENEYTTVKSRELKIEFPDPDINPDIVKLFHPNIQSIHFQNPSKPRYCFIKMAKNVDIDDAIKELEKVQFGGGNLKVKRKSKDDNSMPEDINPYILYIGNLPESLNKNELKSKFPTAALIEHYPEKMRNTR